MKLRYMKKILKSEHIQAAVLFLFEVSFFLPFSLIKILLFFLLNPPFKNLPPAPRAASFSALNKAKKKTTQSSDLSLR